MSSVSARGGEEFLIARLAIQMSVILWQGDTDSSAAGEIRWAMTEQSSEHEGSAVLQKFAALYTRHYL
jgi:hypothetical protein